MKQIKAIEPTFLKKRPINSDQLTALEKVAVPKGRTYGVGKVITTNAGHTQVELASNAGTFWVFTKHWEGLKSNLVTLSQVEHIFANMISQSLLKDINQALEDFEINTPNRIRHFLSQCAHESGGGKWMLEFASGEDYEWREDLKNTEPGFGVRYKGAGLIQVTGRRNYEKFSEFIKPTDPKILEVGATYVAKKYPARISGFWWDNNWMNELCDRNPTVKSVTLRVNGGTTALLEREAVYSRACEVIK